MSQRISFGALVLAASAFFSEPASAAFDEPFKIFQAAHRAVDTPVVAVAPNDSAVFVWDEYNSSTGASRIRLRPRDANGVLGSIATLSAPDADFPSIAMDREGNSLTVWQQFKGIYDFKVQARYRHANGTIGSVENISTFSLSDFIPTVAVAMHPDGDAIIVWKHFTDFEDSTRRVLMRIRAKDGTLGPIMRLSTQGVDAGDPAVAMSPNGHAAIVWKEAGGMIQAMFRSPAGVLSKAEPIYGGPSSDVHHAIDNNGDALFAWAVVSAGESYGVEARVRFADGDFTAVRTLTRNRGAYYVRAALDADGDGLVTWLNRSNAGRKMRGRAVTPEGRFLDAVDLSLPGGLLDPQIAMTPRGAITLMWLRQSDSGNRIEARSRTAGGEWRPVETLSDADSSASDPMVAVNRSGYAIAGWTSGDEFGGDEALEAAVDP